MTIMSEPTRFHLSGERVSIVCEFTFIETYGTDNKPKGPLTIHIITGEFPDGRLGEVFVKAGKKGSETRGLVDTICQDISLGLQYGIPLRVFADKHMFCKFPPDGFVKGPPGINKCTSIIDLIFKWVTSQYDLDTGYRLSNKRPQIPEKSPQTTVE